MTTRFNIPRWREHYIGVDLAAYLTGAPPGGGVPGGPFVVEEKTSSEHVSSVVITATIIGAPLSALNAYVDAYYSDSTSNGVLGSD